MSGNAWMVSLLVVAWAAFGTRASAVSLEEVKQERLPAVVALPEFSRVGKAGDTVFVLRGQLRESTEKRVHNLVRAVQRDVRRRFLAGKDKSGLRPVDVCVFDSAQAYRRFSAEVLGDDHDPTDRGFYVPYRRILAVDISRGDGPLRHELVHPLLADDPGALPYWMDEGIAMLYASALRSKRGFRFRVDHRLGYVSSAKKAGRLPWLAELAASDDRDVYGARYRAYYGLGQYLLLYLDRRGRLEKFVKAMRGGPSSAERQLKVLKKFVSRKKFLSWVERLESARRASER
jgi:hypothetical protein